MCATNCSWHGFFLSSAFAIGLVFLGSPSMKRFAGSVVLAVTMLLVPVSSNATLITLSGILSGANESPVVLTPATGFAQVTLDTVAQTLHIVLSFSGLTSNTTAAHIH